MPGCDGSRDLRSLSGQGQAVRSHQARWRETGGRRSGTAVSLDLLFCPLRYFYSDLQCSSRCPGILATARQGSLGNGGSSPRSHSRGGSGSKSDVDILCLQRFVLEETTGGLLSDGFSPCISLLKVSEPGKLGGWSSRSTSFADLPCSREQHGPWSESTATSESAFRGGGTSPAGLHELVTTWPPEEEHMGDI